MKQTKYLPFLLALLLPASVALAQTRDSRASTPSPEGDEISAARSRYTQTVDVSREDNDGKTLAQLPRRGSGMPLPPHRGYPQRDSYQSRWMDRGSAGHAVIGAAIGFTLGALLGAKANTDQHSGATVGAVIIFGGVGALIGGFIGGSHVGSYPFADHRRIHPQTLPEDEEADRGADPPGSHVKESLTDRSVSTRLASPSQVPGVEALAPPLQGTLAVP
jgi:hypothetical protein